MFLLLKYKTLVKLDFTKKKRNPNPNELKLKRIQSLLSNLEFSPILFLKKLSGNIPS